MQITITGPRGSGTSTLAAYMLRHLSCFLGQQVKIISRNEEAEKKIIELSKSNDVLFRERAEITIVVGVEQEDEESVNLRDAR